LPAPRLLVLIGLPGSGKSTLAKRLLAATPSRILVSTDAIRAQLFGDEATQGSWLPIWHEVGRQFRQSAGIEERCEVIYDATNAVRKHRRAVISLARASGFIHLTAVWLDVPLAVCLRRNRARDRQVPEVVIERMYRCLSGAPPSAEEGFDCLIRYTAFY